MKIPVFYLPEQSVDSRGYSPSGDKPEKVVKDWSERFPESVEVKGFRPVGAEDLSEVHDADHVRLVLDGARRNGHGNNEDEVTQSCLWTVGSFVEATVEAMRNGKVACSPTSGFHHAGFASCGGYCTFNGLALAAKMAIEAGADVAVIDCDAHFGNGTEDIFRNLPVFEGRVLHWTFGRDSVGKYKPKVFNKQIDDLLCRLLDLPSKKKVVLYQAGADVHVKDPLGPGPGVGLTAKQMEARDAFVFNICHDCNFPVVWNLAGGYQTGKLTFLHRLTMGACIQEFESEQ